MTGLDIPSGDALNAVERSRLDELESVIRRGLQSFIEAGEALTEVRESKLYRDSHNTFEEYCRDRWSISDSRARQLVAAAETVTTVTVAGLPAPSNEAQARELAPLREEPEKLRATWAEANRATGGKPTAAAVRQAREQIAPRLVPPVRPAPQPLRPLRVPPTPAPQPEAEIVDAEIVEEDSRRDAELNALLAETDIKFRATFSSALAKADDVWQFNVPRIAEVFANPSDRQRVLSWIREMNVWCDRVSEALTKTTVLRSIGGDR